MKKIIMILVITLFCFGCTNEAKNTNINIEENIDKKNTEIIQTKQQIGEELSVKNDVKNDEIVDSNELELYQSEKKDEMILNNEETNVENNISQDKSKLQQAKDWYAENKDELSQINKEILEEDKNTINSIIDETTSWYEENKEELGSISKEILENDKNTINGIIDKSSTWYEENKDELKQYSQKIYENDKETLNDLYNIVKNVE